MLFRSLASGIGNAHSEREREALRQQKQGTERDTLKKQEVRKTSIVDVKCLRKYMSGRMFCSSVSLHLEGTSH